MTKKNDPASGGADGIANSSWAGMSEAKPSTPHNADKPVHFSPSVFGATLAAILAARIAEGRNDATYRSALTDFLVRAFTERVRLIGVQPPASNCDDHRARAAFWFEGHPTFDGYTIDATPEPMNDLVTLLQAQWDCDCVHGEFQEAFG